MLIHTSDLHIGAFIDKPLRDAPINALEEIADYAFKNGVKYLVIAGDLFESPRLENYELIKKTFMVFRKLRDNGVHAVLTPGSHDYSLTGRDLVSLLKTAGLVHIPSFEFSNNKLILHPLELDDYVFYAIPGLKNSIEIDYMRENRVVYSDLSKFSKPIVLIAHTGLEIYGYLPNDYSSRYGKIEIAQRVLEKIPSEIKYVALGHIHFPHPLLDSANINASYPGSPVGRDFLDLYETLVLRRKYGRNRRFLLVDTSHDIPYVKSVWSDFGVSVEEIELNEGDVNKLISSIKNVLNLLANSKFRALIVTVNKPAPWINDVSREILALERETNSYIRLRTREMFDESRKIILRLPDVEELENVEREALMQYMKSRNIDVSIEKIYELLNLLSKTPEGTRERDFIEELFKQAEAILKEVVKR